MEELKCCFDEYCEHGNNEADLLKVLQKFPDDTLCPMEVIKKVAKLVENCQRLQNHLQHANLKVERLSRSTSDLETKTKQWEKSHQVVTRDRDRLQSELNKLILCKDRLENLCRELQKEKKKMEEECNNKIKGEDIKRKEFADRVNESINQLKQQISNNQEQQERLYEENIQLTDKLDKSVEVVKHHEKALEKYEEREKTFNQLISAKDEERKILQQKYENAVRLMQEIHKNEVDKFKGQIEELIAQRKTVEESFVDQAKSYDQKFAQMSVLVAESQTTITKYKKEMGEITKFIKKLHEESLKSKATIAALSAEKSRVCQSNEATNKKLQTLENLCRRLQADRRILVSLCKTHGLSEALELQLAVSENEKAIEEHPILPPTMANSTSSNSGIESTQETDCPPPCVLDIPAECLETVQESCQEQTIEENSQLIDNDSFRHDGSIAGVKVLPSISDVVVNNETCVSEPPVVKSDDLYDTGDA